MASSLAEAQRLLPQFKAAVNGGDVQAAKGQLTALKVRPLSRVRPRALFSFFLSPLFPFIPPRSQILMTTFPSQASAAAPSAEESAVARECLVICEGGGATNESSQTREFWLTA